MELFYAHKVSDGNCFLDADESAHCVKVLRHKTGDEINVVNGLGTLYKCRLINDSHKAAEAEIVDINNNFGVHDYELIMAVCPTKNNERYEWFIEKATELGVDRIVPVIGEHSERKVYKTQRANKIVVSAAKQSLKAKFPIVSEPQTVKEFIDSVKELQATKLIAWCFEGQEQRRAINDALGQSRKAIILIGPEGDFSVHEGSYAVQNGFIPVHLGASRLRTETAAVTAVEAMYLKNI